MKTKQEIVQNWLPRYTGQNLKDFGEYKFACGRYRGMLTVKDFIIETAQKLEEDDD